MEDLDPYLAAGVLLVLVAGGFLGPTIADDIEECGPDSGFLCTSVTDLKRTLRFYLQIGFTVVGAIGVGLAVYGYRRTHRGGPDEG